MRETKVRALLGAAAAALCLVGVVSAGAAESDGPPSAGPAGNVWYVDPPYAPAGALATATWQPPSTLGEPDVALAGLPEGIPDAARAEEPELPEPDGWTFGDGFPRTSGSGRYYKGAYFWSDFLYDDNGAIGVQPVNSEEPSKVPSINESTGAPAFGTYFYPEADAGRNGADIFRVAVGRKRQGSDVITEWRVDWNTLINPNLPIAMFTIDSDPSKGTTDWPGNTGLKSAGIDYALTISGQAARLVDLNTGAVLPASVRVDMASRSFIASTTEIPTQGQAVVRVAAGLADDAGTGFKTLDVTHGARPGQPNVYNVAYRDYADEPSVDNSWYDTFQAKALSTGGDVSAFSATIEWGHLDPSYQEDEQLLTGYTNRWYVSSVEFGQGMRDPGQGISVGGPPAYLGRVQPYGIYVPTTYRHHSPSDPATAPSRLTWMLHGASSSHNSTMVHPRYIESACERRNSICVSPLGRGPSGGWRTYAELDFWEVWNRVARAYTLDSTQTILTGISMGAFGTYKIAMDHPEAFEAAVTIVGNATSSETGLDRLTNLRWIPLYARHGAADQLVTIDTEIATQNALNALGLRHVYDFHPAEDHIVVALKDAYDDVADWMMGVDELRAAGTLNATEVPAVITWALKPPRTDDVLTFESSHRINRPGAWWLQQVTRREPKAASNIDATSFAISNPPVTPVQYDEPRVLASPSPAVRHILRWDYGTALETEPEMTVDLVNIATLTIDLDQAGLEKGPATITLETDGQVTVRLVRNGNVVAGPSNFGAGQHTIEIAA